MIADYGIQIMSQRDYVTASRFLAIAKHRPKAPLDGVLKASSLHHFFVTASRFLAIAKHRPKAPLDGVLKASSLHHFFVTASRFLAKQSPP